MKFLQGNCRDVFKQSKMQIEYQCYVVQAAFRIYECICITFCSWEMLYLKKTLQSGISMQVIE